MPFERLDRWALLGLIASDASYRRAFAPDARLGTFADSSPEEDLLEPAVLQRAGLSGRRQGAETVVTGERDADGVAFETQWTFVQRIQGKHGFSAAIFRDDVTKRAIVAFTGTTEWNDWWSNLRLGTEQWSAARSEVLRAVA
ncbi:MAG TPA: hypothetical protein VFX05_02145, partial [Casimicrobiaceae bacterium]|nr:hypothetical protein [Casimicrobiaceae bacterium]